MGGENQIEAQRSGFDLERKKETEDMELGAKDTSGMYQASSDEVKSE